MFHGVISAGVFDYTIGCQNRPSKSTFLYESARRKAKSDECHDLAFILADSSLGQCPNIWMLLALHFGHLG